MSNKPVPIRKIISRAEKANGGSYVLECGHTVDVAGDDWDECVLEKWPCSTCWNLGRV